MAGYNQFDNIYCSSLVCGTNMDKYLGLADQEDTCPTQRSKHPKGECPSHISCDFLIHFFAAQGFGPANTPCLARMKIG